MTDLRPDHAVHPAPGSQPDWLRSVRSLIERADDLDGAFELVAHVVGEHLGSGLAVWIGHRENDGLGHPVHACAYAGADLQHQAGLVSRLRGEGLSGGILVDAIGREERSLVGLSANSRDIALGEAIQQFRSALSIPMFSCSGHLGWFVYLARRAIDTDERDLDKLTLYVNLFSAQVANHRYTTELRSAQTWIEQEVAKIAGIQRALMPDQQSPSPVSGLEVAVSFRAFGQAGGDYYDLVGLPELGQGFDFEGEPPRWGVILADASGHGASAAVEVAMLDAILRTFPGPAQGPAAVLAYANRHLFTRRLRGTFITAFVANYSRARKTLTYASAGHNPPLLLRSGSSGEILTLDRDGGLPLLIDRDCGWTDVTIPIDEGDVLVLYTDGIPETRNATGEEFGMERLHEVVGRSRRNPKSIVTAIEMAVDDFRDGVDPRDDQTLVALKILPSD